MSLYSIIVSYKSTNINNHFYIPCFLHTFPVFSTMEVKVENDTQSILNTQSIFILVLFIFIKHFPDMLQNIISLLETGKSLSLSQTALIFENLKSYN